MMMTAQTQPRAFGEAWSAVGSGVLVVQALALLMLSSFVGCQTPERRTGMINTLDDPGLSERQLRIELYDLLDLASGIIEQSADEGHHSTDDPRIRRNLLRLKANAIALLQGAAFNNDPVIGLIDFWVAAIQMREFLESPVGYEALGESRQMAVDDTRRIEAAAEALAGRLGNADELAEIRSNIEEWTATHKIESITMARASAASELVAHTLDEPGGVLTVIHDLKYQIDDLSERLAVYAAILPKQARWQAEIVVDGMLQEGEVLRVLEDIASIEESLKEIAEVFESTPSILEKEREAVVAALAAERAIILEALAEERATVLEAVDSQRMATLDVLRDERAVVLEGVDSQRLATLEALTGEREELLRFLDAERASATDDVERVTVATIDQGLEGVGELADALLTRLAIYAAIGLLLCYAGALTLVLVHKRTPT